MLGFRVWFHTKGKAIARGKARAGNGGSGVRSVTEGIEGADVPGLVLDQREAIAGGEARAENGGSGVWCQTKGKTIARGEARAGNGDSREKGEKREQRGYH